MNQEVTIYYRGTRKYSLKTPVIINPMNKTNKTYKTLQSLILASEGKTLEDELGEGCEVILKKPILWNGGYQKEFKVIGEDDGQYLIFFGIRSIDYIETPVYREDIDEILGKDIDLARILLALGKIYKWVRCTTINSETFITASNFSDDEWDIEWNLENSLHLQSSDTFTKLIEILS